jgi:hypothetical protein
MNRKALLLVLWLIAALGWMAVAQSIPRVGSQSVLINLPKEYHIEELVQMVQPFVDAEADIYISSVDTLSQADVAALTARIPARFFNLQPGLSGGPRVTVIAASEQFERHFDKALFLGGGWYDEYFEPSGYTQSTQPAYADDLYEWTESLVTEGAVIGAVGAGLYPVVYSGILPAGAVVPAYPCPDLISVIAEQGYQPVEAAQTPRSDGTWPPLVAAEVTVSDTTYAEWSRVVMSPIPNSWYDTTPRFGALLVDDYTEPYQESVNAIEDAYHTLPILGVDVIIAYVQCGVDSVVTLRNDSLEAIDLSGWKLQTVDPDDNIVVVEHTFSTYVLQPGETVKVYVGESAPEGTPETLIWPIQSAFGMGMPDGRAVLINSDGFEESSYECSAPQS